MLTRSPPPRDIAPSASTYDHSVDKSNAVTIKGADMVRVLTKRVGKDLRWRGVLFFRRQERHVGDRRRGRAAGQCFGVLLSSPIRSRNGSYLCDLVPRGELQGT